MNLLLRPFGYGLLGGLVGSILNVLWGALIEPEAASPDWIAGVILTVLIQVPFVIVASAAGVVVGSKLSPGYARQLGTLPGFLLGIAFWSIFPDIRALPWMLLSLAPALASGAAAVVHSGDIYSRETADPKMDEGQNSHRA